MIIRLADIEKDALALLDLAKDCIPRMNSLDCFPKNDDELLKCGGRIFTMDGMEIVVAETEGEIVGGIGMIYGPFLWNPKVKTAHELFMWTKEKASNTTFLRLLREVEKRIKLHKADMIEFTSLSSNPESLKNVYRKMGLFETQSSWMRMT